MWNEPWRLAMQEIKTQKKALLATILGAVVLAFITIMLVERSMLEQAYTSFVFNSAVLDLVFLGITPSFGALFVSKPYISWQTLSEDPFRRRLAFYRTLPISLETITRSRMIFALFVLTIVSLFYYAALYFLLPYFYIESLSSHALILFVLFWFGYAMSLTGLNPLIEFGASTKMFFILPFVFTVFYFTAGIFVYNVTGQGIVQWSIVFINNWGWGAVLLSFAAGVLGLYGFQIALKKRLMSRDYV